MKHYEIEGMRYEVFLKRFYKFDLRISRPKKAEFIQLIDSEIDHKADFDSRFTAVQSRLQKAIDIFENKEINNLEKTRKISELNETLANAKNTNSLNHFLEEALQISAEYK
jgi:hypothetical protein